MKQVCIIGVGQFGSHLARNLVNLGCEVMIIDTDERRVDLMRDDVHRALVGDARDYTMLSSVVSASIDEAVICLGEKNLEPSVLCALNLRKIGIKSIRSTATNDDHAQILRAVGATETIFPERDAAARTARQVANPDIKDLFPLAEDYRILEIEAPDTTHGKSLSQLDLRSRFDILVLAIRDAVDPHFRFLPPPDRVILTGQILMVLGRELDLVRFASSG